MRRPFNLLALVLMCCVSVACSGNEQDEDPIPVIDDTGPDAEPDTNPGDDCEGLSEGASRCDGAMIVTCTNGELQSASCDEGSTCDGGACICDNVSDGLCPEGCSSDPDCNTTCVPECSGLDCGPDGCGGSCGTCDTGDYCNAGTCETFDPLCNDTCGPVGEAGGYANDGECDDVGEGGAGYCELGSDCSDCGARELPPIHCELNYNDDCPVGQRCDCDETSGECICEVGARGTAGPGEACTDTHDCESGLCFDEQCSARCDTGADCPSEMPSCNFLGYCAPDACEPSCDGLTCGDDGCGGSCGSCGDGDICTDGACVSGDDEAIFCLASGHCTSDQVCLLSLKSSGVTSVCKSDDDPIAERVFEASEEGQSYLHIGCDDDTDCDAGERCKWGVYSTYCADDDSNLIACNTDAPQPQCGSGNRCCPRSSFTRGEIYEELNLGICYPNTMACP